MRAQALLLPQMWGVVHGWLENRFCSFRTHLVLEFANEIGKPFIMHISVYFMPMISAGIINKPCLSRTLMNSFWRAFSSGKKLDIALESLRARVLSSLVNWWASQSALNSLNIGWRRMIGIVATAEGGWLQQKPFWDVEVCKLCIALGIPSAEGNSFGKR